MAARRTMTAAELAEETGADHALLKRLVDIQVLRPDAEGRLSAGDVIRVEAIRALVEAGADLDQIGVALDSGEFTFEFLDRFFPEPAPRTGPTPPALAASLGLPPDVLSSCYLAMGLPEPAASQPLRQDEAEVLSEFASLWNLAGPSTLLRAARLVGEPARLIAEGWTRLFVDRVGELLDSLDPEERIEVSVATTERAVWLAPRVLQWLLFAHLRHASDRASIEGLEAVLTARGFADPLPRSQPAIAFVDLTGYTRLTADQGDVAAVRSAELLREHAASAVRPVRGRLVKLLGDGAMMYFPDTASAVRAVRSLLDTLAAHGMAAHAGLHTGPIVAHDGDYYGSTVNLASRLADVATAGHLVVSGDVLAAPGLADVHTEPLGTVQVKGIPAPVDLFTVGPAL